MDVAVNIPIETNVPIPRRSRARLFNWNVLKTLDVGSSFVITPELYGRSNSDFRVSAVKVSAYRNARIFGIGITTAEELAEDGSLMGVRVWRRF